ncbi:titin-like [Phlebotomus argentipes]|uniref:titin-like n=1 Tax=Phlebotomus argentipes TaxID=94469 RepID=UPI002892B2B6|nr:titin-like [Phlebotomus argentipes]
MESGERVEEKLPDATEDTSQKCEEAPEVPKVEKTNSGVAEDAPKEDPVVEEKVDEAKESPVELTEGEEVKCPESNLIEFKGGGQEDSTEREDRVPHSTTSLRGSESPIPVGNLPPPRSRRPQLMDNLKRKTTSESSEPESLEDEDSPPPSVAPSVAPAKEDTDLTSGYINKRSSLYVKNPDFTKRMNQTPQPPTAQVSTIRSAPVSNDLSPLRMKPPDFTKIVQSSPKAAPSPQNVTPSNFEEISRKYNYISDLQLKPSTASPASTSYRNLYVSAPTFTSHKFHGDAKPEEATEEPTAHVIHKKPQYLPPSPQESVARGYKSQQYLPKTDRVAQKTYAYGSPPVKPVTPKASVIQQQVPQDLYGQRAYMMPPQVARSPVVIKHPPSPGGSMNPPQNWPGRVTPQSPHNGSAHSPNFLQPAPVYKSSPSPQGNSYYPPNGGTYYAPKAVAKEKPPIEYVDLTKSDGRSARSESLSRSQVYEMRHSSSESNLAYYRQMKESQQQPMPYPGSSSKQSVPYRYPTHPPVKETLPKTYRYPQSPQEPVYERNPSVIERLPSAAPSAASYEPPPVVKVKTEVPPKAPTATATTNSVFAPVKRESPLDLSVKTVKTKADSTGCDDIGSSSSKAREASHALKVNYVPNFQKHTQETNEYRPPFAGYEAARPIPPNAGQVLAKRVAVPEPQHRSAYVKPSGSYYPAQPPRAAEPQRSDYPAGMYYDPKRPAERVAYYPRESVLQPPNATNVIKSVKQEYQYQQYPAKPEVRTPVARYENHVGYKYPQAIPPAEYPQAYPKAHLEVPQRQESSIPYQYNYPKPVPEKEPERKRPAAEGYPYEMVPPKKSPKLETPIQQKVDAYLNNAGYYKSHHYPHPGTPPQHPPHPPQHPPHPPQHPPHPPQHPPHPPQHPPQHPPHPSQHQSVPPPPQHPQYPPQHVPHHQHSQHLHAAIPHVLPNPPTPRPQPQMPYQYRPGEYPYAPKEVKNVQEKTAEPSAAVYYPPTPKKDVHPVSYTSESPVRYSVQQSYRAAIPYEHQRIAGPSPAPQIPYEGEFRGHPPISGYSGGSTNTVTARQWYPSLPPQQNHQYMPPGQVYHQRPPDPVPQAPPQPAPASNLIRATSDERLGANRDVISKLKTTIEGKQKVRKQNSGELDEEEASKADIASLLAARIRTKGELKGFTPIPDKDAPASVEEEPVAPVAGPIDPPSDLEGTSAFDLLDFGSACNDFVEQLQTGKKKMKRRRSRKSEVGDVKLEVKEEAEEADVTIPPESIVPQEAIQKAAESLKQSQKVEKPATSSSDEDKPLFLLRQQSEEVKKAKKKTSTDEDEDPASKRAEIFERLADKITKNIREKQEKRLAARLNTSSSDDEESSKGSQRKRKPLRRTKTRSVKTSEDSSNEEDKKKEDDKSVKKTKKPPESSSEDDEEENGKKAKGKKSSRSPAKRKPTRKSSSSEEGSDSGEEGDSEEKSKSKNSSAAKSTDGGKEKPPPSRTKTTRRSQVGTEDSMSMTRSKKRKEMEQRLANSKVLRNDKIVQNVTIDKKKKPAKASLKVDEAKRKILDTDSEPDAKGSPSKKKPRRVSKLQSSSSSESSESESEAETVSERLRPRKPQQKAVITATPPKNGKVSGGGKGESSPGKKNNAKITTLEGTTDTDAGDNKFPPGWEMQLYEYKRSLKIPPSLITIARPSWHRISTSLPDLDPHSSDASESYREAAKKEAPLDESTKSSIIDLLHQRVTQKGRQTTLRKTPKAPTKTLVKSPNSNGAQLLATPGVDDDDRSIFGHDGKNLNTNVLKSRTRTEYRIMKNKEIIRQVFGGEDRPASAPPFRGGVDESPVVVKQEPNEDPPKAVTFDQKFQEYIRQIDRMAIEEGFVRDTSNRALKTEKDFGEDTETQDTVLESQSVNSERDGLTPISFTNVIRRQAKKGSRSVRRKGSSGFDYIRKKKKPLTESQQAALAKKRLAAVTEFQGRDEQDIGREVKAWVLNKGVGESVLHKAARLNYLDVIAYCLDRMEMHPDQKDNAGYTPLHEACSRGHLEIARLLLEYGANHSETALSGIRPLHDAVENGYVEVARLLLSYGADPLLATYAGQTPLALAEDDGMALFLKNHLYDVQHNGPDKGSWKFAGPWEIYDPDVWGYSIFADVPEADAPEIKEPEKCDSNSNIMKKAPEPVENGRANGSSVSLETEDGELFDIEESETPLPPLYLLRDEGAEKWVLLSDLCNMLKVKSRDTLLKQIQPGGVPGTQKELIRELKTGDFLQKATCLQLLCAGEKLNIRSSKVVLIKYNESVQALLGVQTLLMRL